MRTLFLDAFSGAAGNMLLGLLLDLGADRKVIFTELEKLQIGKYELIDQKVDKCGIESTYFDVECEDFGGLFNKLKRVTGSTEHFRNLQAIRTILDKSELSANVKEKSLAVFRALAEAEAKVHGKSVEDVHFHEVGAVDTIIDIVGCVLALENLGIEQIMLEKICTGRGFVKCAHGTMPIPAPATAELLKKMPHYAGDTEKELLTPTGAALLNVLTNRIAPLPTNFVLEKVGYGAGKLDLPIPNVLRGYLGVLQPMENDLPVGHDGLYVLETNIDDMNPQFYEVLMSKVLEMGAVDVWLTPIIMKKNRPAHTLSLLVPYKLIDTISAVIMRETTSIGVRFYAVDRKIATRTLQEVQVAGYPVQVKYSCYAGQQVNAMPEYEDCKRVAAQTGLPLKEVWQRALLEAVK